MKAHLFAFSRLTLTLVSVASFLVSTVLTPQSAMAEANGEIVESNNSYILVRNLLISEKPEKEFSKNQNQYFLIAEDPATAELLNDAIIKLGNPAWSKELRKKSRQVATQKENQDNFEVQQLRTKNDSSSETWSSGNWKWYALGAIAIFATADYMKNKQVVFTGFK